MELMALRNLKLPEDRPVAVGEYTELWLPKRKEFPFVHQLRARSDVYRWFNDPTRWSEKKTQSELERCLTCAADTLLVIRHIRSRELVGFLGCREPDDEFAAITVGRMALDKPTVKRLLKTKCCTMDEARVLMLDASAGMLRFLFEEAKVRLARAYSFKTNAPSLNLIRRLGFDPVPAPLVKLREHYLYFELTEKRWRTINGNNKDSPITGHEGAS